MLPALSQLHVFRSHELSRLGTSCNLAEASKDNPEVAGSAVSLGQPRTNSGHGAASVQSPIEKAILICGLWSLQPP